MLSAKNRVFIIKPDGSKPEIGYFACRFGRGALEQPVAVFLTADMWSLFINGSLVAQSPSWRLAFGPYALMDCFIGRPLSHGEYMKLIEVRHHDFEQGIDIEAPDINLIPPRI